MEGSIFLAHLFLASTLKPPTNRFLAITMNTEIRVSPCWGESDMPLNHASRQLHPLTVTDPFWCAPHLFSAGRAGLKWRRPARPQHRSFRPDMME